ncbi:MAG: copper resistance protein CopC/CopD, partial [Gemmatimonadota bacterium]|nr:copper resistance protein CopC/CopD [Gemmatimonadota bacterium]
FARTCALAVAASVILWPALLFAHGVLRRSEPSNGAILRAAPSVIRLTFSEPPQLSFTRVQLVGPDSQPVVISPLRIAAPDSTRTIVADVVGPLLAGLHRILWQITSADGHPVRGTIAFRIAEDATGLIVVPSIPADTSPPPVVAQPIAQTEFGVDSWPYSLIRIAAYAAIIVIVGAVVFALIVAPSTHHRVPDLDATFVIDARRLAAKTGFIATIVLAVAVAARFVAQSFAVNGTAPTGEFIANVVRTPWGIGFVLHALAAVVLLAAFARTRSAYWRLAALAAVMLGVGSALSGHAAASGRWTTTAVVSDTVHILAAGGWLGALLLILAAGLPATARMEPLGRGQAVRGMVHAFSPMALAFAGALALTGVIAAVLHLGTWSALTGSDYGRILLIKIAVLVLVLAVAAYNWRRLRPTLDGDRVATFRRTARAELLLAFVVLVVTAWLVVTPPPGASQ